MSSKTDTTKVVKVITYVLVVLVVVGIIGLIFTLTNGFNEDFKTFYVEYNGEKILTSNKKLLLDSGEEHRFDTKYVFDSDSVDVQGYNVSITPNDEEGNQFEFTVDGNLYIFDSDLDLTKAFNITKGEDYFTITIDAGTTVESILQATYPESEVVVPEQASEIQYPFTLVVSSYNGEVVYYLDFAINMKTSDIKLDMEEMVF